MRDLSKRSGSQMKHAERKSSWWLSCGLALSLLSWADGSYAATASLTWNANTESDLAGYRVYKRQLPSSDYGSPVFSGLPSNSAAPQATISGLLEGESYGFIATAYDSSGNESGPSTEKQISLSAGGNGGGGNNGGNGGGNTSTGGDVVVWLGDGVKAPTTTGVITAGVPAEWKITGVADLDGDGQDDLVWRNKTTGDVAVWLGNGVEAPTTMGVITAAVPAEWKIVSVGDLNGDGKADLVWRNTVTGDLSAWLGNGVNTPTTMAVIATAISAAWVVADMGDLDGDGKADLLWRHTTTGDVGAWLMNGLTASSTGMLANNLSLDWKIADLGDLDGNGTDDLVWREKKNGSVTAWLMNGLNVSDWGVIANSIPLTWEIAGMGDLDGNGMDDLVWREKTVGSVNTWLMNGLSLNEWGVLASTVSTNRKIAGLGDLNGDGIEDLLWRH